MEEAPAWGAGQVAEFGRLARFACVYLTQPTVAALPLADDAILDAQPAAAAPLAARRPLRQAKEAADGGVGRVGDWQRLLGAAADATNAQAQVGGDEA